MNLLFSFEPYYLLSTDDTVWYVYKYKGSEEDSFRLIHKSSLDKVDTRPNYKINDALNIKEMIVKLTINFSAIGYYTLIFISA